jgi:hypothetical protein
LTEVLENIYFSVVELLGAVGLVGLRERCRRASRGICVAQTVKVNGLKLTSAGGRVLVVAVNTD